MAATTNMSNDTLRNQLLGLGFKPPAPEPKRADGAKRGGRPGAAPQDRRGGRGKPQSGQSRPGQTKGAPDRGASRPGRDKPNSREDIDLAKAYAIRSQREKDERIRAEQARQAEARQRREARARLAELVKDKGLNVANADIARHFPYGGKIKRIHVTAEQLKALNAGELGVLQMDGRYLLVTAELLAQAEQVFAPAVALKVDPEAPVEGDSYADPKYQVPDDLVW
ncbi:DUF2058 family protein [Lysobacter sp. F6437]|uniref:DUF2058 family protein n=1 Tax=Lysobacter sp. F6437 TaxID=3459296 RepID=UPI00403DB315